MWLEQSGEYTPVRPRRMGSGRQFTLCIGDQVVKVAGIIGNNDGQVTATGRPHRIMPSIASAFRSRLFPLLVLFTALMPVLAEAAAPQPLTYNRTQSLTTLDIIERLERHHYSRINIDDALSEHLLESYLRNLDPGHSVFLATDIEEFRQLRDSLDDQLLAGDPSAGFLIYNRYDERLRARLSRLITELPQMIRDMDFTVDEDMVIDRKSLDWPANAQEADEIWRKQIKSSVLSLKLAGKEMKDIEELLLKRYRNQLRRMHQINGDDVYQLYMNTFTGLFDPHTNYLSPRTSENFNMSMRLSLEGIGAVLQQEDEFTKVARLVPGGPAARQGELKQADRIVAVGQGKSAELTDVVGWRLDDVVDLIRGKKGTTVRLAIVRGSGATEEHATIAIVREQVKLEEQAAKSRVLELPEEDGKVHRVGVIDVPAFYADFEAMQRGDHNYRSTTRDVAQLLDELQQQDVEGVIIDLRDNGGGSLLEAHALTGLFIESGPTVQIRHSNERVEYKRKFRDGVYYSGPLLVLINRLSASASEIFAGAIQDYGRGLIVGTDSFGKGTVQSLSALNHGQLKLTESKFYRISGDSTQHRGVVPDIELPSIYNTKEVGESALENALPWDRIAAVRHQTYQDLAPLLPALRERHDERARTDPDLRQLSEEIALERKYAAEKSISLNETVRRSERRKRQQEELAIENENRVAKGLEPLAALKQPQPDQDEADDDAAGDAQAEPSKEEDAPDALLTESGRILLDAIHLGERVAAAH